MPLTIVRALCHVELVSQKFGPESPESPLMLRKIYRQREQKIETWLHVSIIVIGLYRHNVSEISKIGFDTTTFKI